MNYIKEYKEYCEFLNITDNKPTNQKEAKSMLKEELENIIAINGVNELNETEKKLCNKLNISLHL
ncbi:MAG: hypothetical protein NTU73_10010 [Ignavibacteriae bacterium]|nr:hypothetical protein [Ignavibacteriota bacterium]